MLRDAARIRPTPDSRPRPPWIWMYHSIDTATCDPYGITVEPERLDHQLHWLRRRGLKGVSVTALLRAHAAGRAHDLVGLTFDDGYADFLPHALPVLQQHGCTATVFVLSGHLGGVNCWDPLGPRKPLLSGDDIHAIAAAGMEVGSHGLYHEDLTRLSASELRREVRESRAALHRLTGRMPPGFCYPYGVLDRRVVEAVRAAGYRYACAIGAGFPYGAFALPRVHISHADRSWRLHIKQLLQLAPRCMPPSRSTSTPLVSEHA